MSNVIVSKESILLGNGDVFVLDAASGNYSSNVSVGSSSDLLGRMSNVRIFSKQKTTRKKQIVNGIIMDEDLILNEIEFGLEFSSYEHNAKTQAALFGGALTDVSIALGAILREKKKLRFEIKFTYPIGNKFMWYIFPKCVADSELDFSPGNTEGFTNKGSFIALPAVNEHAIWYETTTPSFHNYIV